MSECMCSGGTKLVFACSGAADVGHISDLAARKLTAEGHGKMFCTAGLGGKVNPILQTTEAADTILALDGCPLDCVRKSLEEAGFSDFKHLRVTDLGLEKCKSEVCDNNVEKVIVAAREILE